MVLVLDICKACVMCNTDIWYISSRLGRGASRIASMSMVKYIKTINNGRDVRSPIIIVIVMICGTRFPGLGISSQM